MRLLAMSLLLCLQSHAALQVRFNFEGTLGTVLTDASGNGHDGIQFNPTNRIVATNYGVGGSQGALFITNGYGIDPPSFPPLGCYLAITNLPNITYLTQATFSVWAQHYNKSSPNLPENNSVEYMDCRWRTDAVPAASNSWTFGKILSDFVALWVSDSTSNARPVVRFPIDGIDYRNGNYATTNFNHYLVTVDCVANQAIAYYNGAPYQTNTVGLPWLYAFGCATQNFIEIGCFCHGGTCQWGDDNFPNNGYMFGLMDEVRIYDNVLTPANVLYIYNNPTLDYPPTPTVSLSGAVQLNGVSSFR